MTSVTVHVHPTVSQAYMAINNPHHTVDQKHIWPGHHLQGYRAEMVYVYPGALEGPKTGLSPNFTSQWFKDYILSRLIDDNPARLVYL